MLTESLREHLREALQGGFSQCDLSAASGISQPQLCRFVAGKRGLQLKTADALCQALGLKLVKA